MFSDILKAFYFLYFPLKNSLPSSTYIRYEIPTTFSQLPSYILTARSFSTVRYVAGIIHTQRSPTMLLTPKYFSLMLFLNCMNYEASFQTRKPFNRRI
jgi:hypothetical protein